MAAQTYITPRALLIGNAAAEAVGARWAWPLLGGRLAFAAIDVSTREGGKLARLGTVARTAYERDAGAMAANLRKAIEAQLGVLAGAPTFAGLDLSKPILMGVLNVTPDSFSDGGQHQTTAKAIAHGVALAEAGAKIIDVGGESTRPGATPVENSEEIARVVPVVKVLVERGLCVSIDTRHAAVMREAVKAGARIINDITALAGDTQALNVAASSGAAVMLMHMQGEPRTMQAAPTYAWAPGDIFDYLSNRVAACMAAGIPRSKIAVDPGLGFGKTDVHNAQLLDHIAMFHGLGCAVAVGASRKGFISRMSHGEGPGGRLAGSLAAALHCAGQGVHVLRVHDVGETRQALAIADRMAAGQ